MPSGVVACLSLSWESSSSFWATNFFWWVISSYWWVTLFCSCKASSAVVVGGSLPAWLMKRKKSWSKWAVHQEFRNDPSVAWVTVQKLKSNLDSPKFEKNTAGWNYSNLLMLLAEAVAMVSLLPVFKFLRVNLSFEYSSINGYSILKKGRSNCWRNSTRLISVHGMRWRVDQFDRIRRYDLVNWNIK